MVERFNKIFVNMLFVYVDEYYNDWDDYFLYVMMVYRLVVYEIICMILNMMMLGWEVVIFFDIVYEMLLFMKRIF